MEWRVVMKKVYEAERHAYVFSMSGASSDIKFSHRMDSLCGWCVFAAYKDMPVFRLVYHIGVF